MTRLVTSLRNYNNMVQSSWKKAHKFWPKQSVILHGVKWPKQVAHEIKNPLTPMKLSIQYLEKAIKQNPRGSHSVISKKISATLSWSKLIILLKLPMLLGILLNLPQSSNVKIEINEVVEMVHNLFRKREDMDITLAVPN